MLGNLGAGYIQAIGVSHVIFSVFMSFYGFFIAKNDYDFLYIFFTVVIVISWTYYNGECSLTYYVKNAEDDNYMAGQESTDMKDTYLLFGSKYISYIIITLLIFVHAMSEYIVLRRNEYPPYLYLSLPALHILYTMSLRIFDSNLHENELFLLIQDAFKAFFIVILMLIVVLRSP